MLAKQTLHTLLLALLSLSVHASHYADDADDDLDSDPISHTPPQPRPATDDDWTAHLFLDAGDFATSNIYWILPTFGTLLFLNVLYFMYAAGRLMREEIVSVRAVELGVAVGEAWTTVTTWAEFGKWRGDIAMTRAYSTAEEEGPSRSTSSKAQSKWEEITPTHGTYLCHTTEVSPTEHVFVHTRTPHTPASGSLWSNFLWRTFAQHASTTWTIEVRPSSPGVNKGSIVYITEQLRIASPFFRFATVMFKGTGGDVTRFLKDLAAESGDTQAVVVRPVQGRLEVGKGPVEDKKDL
ncbi:uncharacterized protein EV422DRAFT_527571 [Fimicolochytrium jonesii]|uniref:uncharacterized protein n=1 Tax=Fimicolochytrium jonesii TaxID=1396493 RepID=UPI0022FE99DA|nr:uncharacterized protein EV422DRAFT_527571 [Fimicolochytrium jonesii]KAI8821294.1 hypothetical protein EV422DRAFT_527571 [Fimicolochytrium jonesii]